MAKKSTQQQRFILERARALAVVYLTRRQDLIVTDESADFGVDLWVMLNLDKNEGHRKFGVQLRGSWTAMGADHANKTPSPSMQGKNRYGPFPFPVVLFCFTMENNEGWYTWAAEPVVTPNGEFVLVQHGEHGKAFCRPLNSEAIDEIVGSVDRWYDAFFSKATRETRTKKPSGSTTR